MGSCYKEKRVFVTVYVEKPKRRTFSNHHHHHHNHPYIHHTIKREVIHFRHGGAGKGYISRRAELLRYTQQLRQSARSQPASTTLSRPNNSNNQHPLTQVVAVPRKPKNSKAPTCFGTWKIPDIFGFFTSSQAKKERKTRKKRSGTTSNKIKAAINSLKVQRKRGGLFSKVFSASKKRKVKL